MGWSFLRGALLGLTAINGAACDWHSVSEAESAGAGASVSRGGAAEGVSGALGVAGSLTASGGSSAGGAAGAAGSSGGSQLPGLRDTLGDPAYPDTFWKTDSVEMSHIDTLLLESAASLIQTSGWEVHSFLVARNGKLVFERYGWNTGTNVADPDKTPHQVLPSERQMQFSTTKSVLSALVGIAIGEGRLSDLQQKAVSFFPDYESLNPSADKAAISLEDLLTMRSGLMFSEGEQDTFSAPDPARAMLARRVVDTPVGTVWNYSSGAADIVAEILRVATGATPLDYANVKLFQPLGIENPPWVAGASGTSHGGWGLSLTAREMARFGELFRNSGLWQGQQVVPASWTNDSTTSRCATSWGDHYAYYWWVPGLPGFFNTMGSFGQAIFVSRDLGLVVVFTANLPNETANLDFQRIIREYLIPALK